MQRDLCRLTDSTTEDQDHRNSQHSRIHVVSTKEIMNADKIKRSGYRKERHDTHDETNITDTIHHKRLQCRTGRRGTLLLWPGLLVNPEADQQVRT